MRVIYQRVSRGEVRVSGKIVAQIGCGALLLVGISQDDDPEALRWMAQKIAGLRVHDDEEGKLNRSLISKGGEVLAVSQFTLLGDCRKGKRPSYTKAAKPEIAEPMFIRFVELLRNEGLKVETGVFGEHMEVDLINDGPVTLILDYPQQ